MPTRRAPRRRPILPLVVAAALAGVPLAVPSATGVAFATPPYTLDDRATAIAGPALIYLEARFEGILRVHATGEPVEPDTLVVTRPCSGFAVAADGYVITTAHCIQPSPDSLRGSAVSLVANDMIKNHKLAAGQRATYVSQLNSTTDFTGTTAGSAPVTKIYAQVHDATGGLTSAPAVEARVVDARPAPGPDLALVKIAANGLPIAQLEKTDPQVGAHVVQIALGTDDVTATPVVYTARSRPSTVVGQYGTRTPPLLKMDGDLGGVSYGGMAVNVNGQVVGVINAGSASDNRSDELITGVTTIDDMLNKAGVKNEPTANDQAYLTGLDAYYAGRYTEAIKKFDAVLAAQPNNKLVDGFRKQAAQRLAIEGDPSASGTPPWLVIGLAGLGGVLVAVAIVTVVLLVRRRSRRAREANRPDPFARGPYAPDPFGMVSAPPFPVSGAPVSDPVSRLSGMPVSGVPVSGAPAPYTNYFGEFPSQESAPPEQVIGEGPTVNTSPTVDPVPLQAGVPAVVHPPRGIPVAHPTWQAAAPLRLPDFPAAQEPEPEPDGAPDPATPPEAQQSPPDPPVPIIPAPQPSTPDSAESGQPTASQESPPSGPWAPPPRRS